MHPDRTQAIFLTLAPTLLMVAISCAMWIKKTYRDLPIFFTYMWYEAVSAIAIFSVWILHRPGSPLYFFTYWSSELVSIGLGLAVVYELFQRVLEPYVAIQTLGRWLFGWAAMILIAVALVTASDHGHEAEALVAGVLMLERSVRIVQAGLLLFLFVFARSLGLTWRNCVLGVALGFALFVGSDLAVVAWRLRAGASENLFSALLIKGSYDAAVVIWAVYFLQSSPVMAADAPKTGVNDLVRWNQTLTEFLYR